MMRTQFAAVAALSLMLIDPAGDASAWAHGPCDIPPPLTADDIPSADLGADLPEAELYDVAPPLLPPSPLELSPAVPPPTRHDISPPVPVPAPHEIRPPVPIPTPDDLRDSFGRPWRPRHRHTYFGRWPSGPMRCTTRTVGAYRWTVCESRR